MANTKVTGALIADATITATNIADGAVTAAKLTGITTTSIAEGDKLFYTDARVGTYLSTNGYDTAANIIATITDSAPVTLDTLNELAAALGDDPNYATTTANLIGTKLPLAGGTLTGNLTMSSTNLIAFGSGTQYIKSPDGSDLTIGAADDVNFNASYIRYFNTSSSYEYTRLHGEQGDSWINANGGRVGIGTNTPEVKLSLYNNASQGNPGNHTPANATLKIQDSSNTMYLDGNSIIQTGAASFTFGNTQDTNILFYTNGSEKVRFQNDGNVGISTTSPSNKLHVYSNSTQGSPSSHTPSGATLQIQDNANSLYIDGNSIIGTGAGELHIGNASNTDMNFWTNGVNRLHIESAGNIGIGTSSPSEKLHIAGSDGDGIKITGGTNNRHILLTTSNLDFRATTAGGWAWGMRSYTNDGATIMNYVAGAYGDGPLSTDFQYNFYGGTAYNNAAMYIPASKNVGIGTSSPESLLHLSKEVNDGLGADLALYNPAYNATSFTRIRMGRHSNRHSAIKAVAMTNGGRNTDIVFEAKRGDGGDDSVFVENVRVLASGGIAFNGDYTAANALDDYEEGTWTATYTDGADNTYTGNYSSRDGHYTKIGNMVYASFQLIATSDIEANGLTGTSSLNISGLPYASNSQHFSGGHITNFQSNGRNMNSVRLVIPRGSTKMFFRDFNNTTETSVNVNEVNGSSTLFYGYVIYRV